MGHCKFKSYHSELMANANFINSLKANSTRNQRNLLLPFTRTAYSLLTNLQFEGFVEQFSISKNRKTILVTLNLKRVKHTNAISLLEANYSKYNKLIYRTVPSKSCYLDCYLMQESPNSVYLSKIAHLR